MTNYWPMSNLSDVVNGANLFNGSNYTFVADRFCSPKSAIYFKKGFLQVPPGVYFFRDFTFTAWANINSFVDGSRIIEFCNGKNDDCIALGLFGATRPRFNFEFNKYGEEYIKWQLQSKQWYHIAFVLRETTGTLYVNGLTTSRFKAEPSISITRNKNFIGGGINKADAIYDELKIYEGAMTDTEVKSDYSTSKSN